MLYQKTRKSEEALKGLREDEGRLKTERSVQNNQLEGLKNLENSLREQLKNI